jgi:hypothetical protein
MLFFALLNVFTVLLNNGILYAFVVILNLLALIYNVLK